LDSSPDRWITVDWGSSLNDRGSELNLTMPIRSKCANHDQDVLKHRFFARSSAPEPTRHPDLISDER
jgi:hypothetical protein